MESLINRIQDLLVEIRDIISGNTITHPYDIEGNKKDVYSVDIPTFKEDRINLKKDRDVVVKSYKKAVDEKRLQLQN